MLPAGASAHVPVAGMQGFYLGLLHPATTASHGLLLLALGVMLAPAWPGRFGRAWAAFAAAALAGLGAVMLGGTALQPGEWTLLAAAALVALYAAAALGRFPAVTLALAGLGGLLLGAGSAPDPGPPGAAAVTAAGSCLGLALGLLYLAGGIGWLRLRFEEPWAGVGLRIAAAWIAAIAILLAALQAAPRGLT